MEKGFEFFLNDLIDEDYIEDFMKPADYIAAAEQKGIPAYDECFGYVPLLCLGGEETAGNLMRVKLKEHLELILSAGGPMM